MADSCQFLWALGSACIFHWRWHGCNVKPVIGGIELDVRYITRANERYQLRAKLYQAAVEMLGHKNVAVPPSA